MDSINFSCLFSAIFLLAQTAAFAEPIGLLNVSYDPTREL